MRPTSDSKAPLALVPFLFSVLLFLFVCSVPGPVVVAPELRKTPAGLDANKRTFSRAEIESGTSEVADAPRHQISEARDTMAQAERLRTTWTEESLRWAAEYYDRAAKIYTNTSDPSNASYATLSSGDVYFVISEYEEALRRYRTVQVNASKKGDWLAEARALSRIGRVQSYLGYNHLAQKQLSKALLLYRQHDARRCRMYSNAYGEALTSLAEVSYALGDFEQSSMQLERAKKVVQEDLQAEARIYLFKGYISGSLGESKKAFGEISHALDLYRQIQDKVGEGLALTALGLSYSLKRDENRAIALHTEAIKNFQSIGDRHSQAIALNALGQSYENLHDYQLALNHYQRAWRLFQEINSIDGASVSAFKIAKSYLLEKDLDRALEYFERCLRLSRVVGKVRTAVNALTEMAKIYAEQGRYGFAAKQYQRIRKFYEVTGDLRGQATALNAYGDVLFQAGNKQKARSVYRRALSLCERVGDEGILLTTLYNVARSNLEIGAPDAALSVIWRSLKTVEHLRANLDKPELRSSYFSGARPHYELAIRILMQLERLRPGQGFAAEALSVSEQGRARLMIDLVTASRAHLVQPASNTLQMPFEQANALTLDQIQNELRDGNTVLLEYALGDEHSYLWSVSGDSFHGYELPDRKTLEDATRELYGLITLRQETSDRVSQTTIAAADKLISEKAANLSSTLLGPVAAELKAKRVLIVADGALQYLPFEALPIPVADTGETEKRLLETHEVVMLPSFSTLVARRHSLKRPSAAKKLIAIVADPVFTRSDDRVRDQPFFVSLELAATDRVAEPPTSLKDGDALTRLAHTSEEADAISAMGPWDSIVVLKGFEARRDSAMSSEVGQYQIVHFATHSLVDSEHPELSGVVLTMVDRNGLSTDGLMVLHDIYSLDLSAELTVLSSCQSALGKDIKGEGLVGLAHGFMSAGSRSVVASLWKVDDRATAVLMTNFYQSILQKGLTPAAALRLAKLKMMRDQRWSAPYYWAGFVIEGEYANHISIEQHPWPSLTAVALCALISGTVILIVFQQRKFLTKSS